MKVSVLITCYNNVNEIDSAIQSVVVQEGNFFLEVLIGDDGSTDGTQERIKRWISRYPKLISLYQMIREDSVSNGERAARNRLNLLKYATGEYINFLDGDDFFTSTQKIAKQLIILEDEANESCSCCAHNITVYNKIDNTYYEMVDTNIKRGVIDCCRYWGTLYFHTNTILFRAKYRDFMLSSPFGYQFNDNLITYMIIQHGPIYYIPDSMAQYNITGNGIWTGKQKVYGYTRNLLAYDAEILINDNFKKLSFYRHLSDILYVYKEIRNYNREGLKDLLPYINREVAPNTFLIIVYDNLTNREKMIRIHILLKAKLAISLVHIKRILHKQKRLTYR